MLLINFSRNKKRNFEGKVPKIRQLRKTRELFKRQKKIGLIQSRERFEQNGKYKIE